MQRGSKLSKVTSIVLGHLVGERQGDAEDGQVNLESDGKCPKLMVDPLSHVHQLLSCEEQMYIQYDPMVIACSGPKNVVPCGMTKHSLQSSM